MNDGSIEHSFCAQEKSVIVLCFSSFRHSETSVQNTKKGLKPKRMREQIDAHDEIRSTSSGSIDLTFGFVFVFVILSNIVSNFSPVSSLVTFLSCPSTSLLFLLSFPSCPSTSLLFHSISSRILFNLFFAVPGTLIVIVEIKLRV